MTHHRHYIPIHAVPGQFPKLTERAVQRLAWRGELKSSTGHSEFARTSVLYVPVRELERLGFKRRIHCLVCSKRFPRHSCYGGLLCGRCYGAINRAQSPTAKGKVVLEVIGALTAHSVALIERSTLASIHNVRDIWKRRTGKRPNRAEVVEWALKNGKGYKATARHFRISPHTVKGWLRKAREKTGDRPVSANTLTLNEAVRDCQLGVTGCELEVKSLRAQLAGAEERLAVARNHLEAAESIFELFNNNSRRQRAA